MQGKARRSPPSYPPRHLLIIVNWSVNWYACIQRSTCTSCRIQSHANPILWTEKALIHLRWHATTSRQCIGVVNKTPRRSTTCITSTTVNRVVAECTKFITHWSLWWKNCVDWIKKWLPWQHPMSNRNPVSQQSSAPVWLPILKIWRSSVGTFWYKCQARIKAGVGLGTVQPSLTSRPRRNAQLFVSLVI